MHRHAVVAWLILPSGTVTFVFTDIEGSTGLWERDRAAMVVAVADHCAVFAATSVVSTTYSAGCSRMLSQPPFSWPLNQGPRLAIRILRAW
jgi:hypothetical protein